MHYAMYMCHGMRSRQRRLDRSAPAPPLRPYEDCGSVSSPS